MEVFCQYHTSVCETWSQLSIIHTVGDQGGIRKVPIIIKISNLILATVYNYLYHPMKDEVGLKYPLCRFIPRPFSLR